MKILKTAYYQLFSNHFLFSFFIHAHVPDRFFVHMQESYTCNWSKSAMSATLCSKAIQWYVSWLLMSSGSITIHENWISASFQLLFQDDATCSTWLNCPKCHQRWLSCFSHASVKDVISLHPHALRRRKWWFHLGIPIPTLLLHHGFLHMVVLLFVGVSSMVMVGIVSAFSEYLPDY